MDLSKQYWTDYPISELGDEDYVIAPIRACKLVSYDGDKYCKVEVEGVLTQIKKCYVYTEKRRYYEPVMSYVGKVNNDRI